MKLYYIGLDVHKKIIAYCIKGQDGEIVREGTVASTRAALQDWAEGLPGPWMGALEATLFSGWIYDFLKPSARDLKVAHPQMLKAIAASKKKNDRVDARMIADLLRCNLLPESYMASERSRALRRVLRYRKLMVGESVRMKNKISGLLMEVVLLTPNADFTERGTLRSFLSQSRTYQSRPLIYSGFQEEITSSSIAFKGGSLVSLYLAPR